MAKYHLGKVKLKQLQPRVFLIGSTWPAGWPPGFCRVSRFIALQIQCYQLTFADQKFSYRLWIIADSCTLSSAPLFCLVARVSILSGKLFPLNYFNVTVLVSRCSFGWFLHSRVAMDTSLPLTASGTPLTLRHQFPSSSICDEFN